MQNEATGEWEYHGIHATIEYVLQRAQTHGPYDGIMAMSQVVLAFRHVLSHDGWRHPGAPRFIIDVNIWSRFTHGQ